MTPSVTYLAIKSDAHGNVSVGTTLNPTAVNHRMLTPGEVFAQSFLHFATKSGACLLHGHQHVPALALVAEVISPDGWGHAVPDDLWRSAKFVLDESREAGGAKQETAR